MCTSVACDENEPADHAACCEKRATCDSFECHENWVHKLSASTISCVGLECIAAKDHDRCCDRRESCSEDVCPSTTHIPKPDIEDLLCAGKDCVDDDKEYCCDARANCAD